MKNRGMGGIYRPTYTQRQPDGTMVTKTAAVWWISYNLHGKRTRESSESTNRADATRLLKQRIGDMQAGMPVGSQVDELRWTKSKMVEADYAANGRNSLDRVKQAEHTCADSLAFTQSARHSGSDHGLRQEVEQGAKAVNRRFRDGDVAAGLPTGRSCRQGRDRPEFPMLHVDNTRKGFFEPGAVSRRLEPPAGLSKACRPIAYITGWRTESELLTRHGAMSISRTAGCGSIRARVRTARAASFPSRRSCGRPRSPAGARPEIEKRTTGAIIPWVFVHA